MLFCSRNQLSHFIAEGQVAAEMLRQSAAIDGDIGCYHHAIEVQKDRDPRKSGGRVKCLRYAQMSCQASGCQFFQESGLTVCGSVTQANALSSKAGSAAAALPLPPKS
jgi:hypothetical protein